MTSQTSASPETPGAAARQASVRNRIDTSIALLRIVSRPKYGQMVWAAVILVLLALFVDAFAKGDIEWAYVAQFMTAPVIMKGLGNTLLMAALAMALGTVLGVLFAIMRISDNRVLNGVAFLYVWLFRAMPALVQLLLWFNLALIFPVLGIPGFFEARTIDVMTPFMAALLGLGIQQGAYTCEVVRGGLQAIDRGQVEAAKALGMTNAKLLRRIVIPQAMRVILPPVGNEFISMVKFTSLASVIQYSEILHSAQAIYFANSRVLELLLVVSFWYLIAVSVLNIAQHYLERHFNRGVSRAGRA